MTANRRGLLIILSSPSGAGKTTLTRRLRDWDASLRFSVSATTRAPRPGEVDGKDYHFLTEAEFKSSVANGEMLEHAHVFGNFYGSPKGPVSEAIEAGRDVLFDVDWQGAQQITNSALGQHVLSVFFLPPSIRELHRRLVSRGQDDDETINKRMLKSWDEISHWDGYNYVLVNDDLDATEAKLKSIVTAERLRRSQQPGLIDHVRKLQTEYEGHAMIYAIDGITPKVSASAWVAPSCHIIGNVTLAEDSSVWFGTTIRGTNDPIVLGKGSNIQENSVLHTDPGCPLTIGEGCTIGHKAMLHGCTIGDNSLIGMGAIVLNRAVIGRNCLIAAGAVIPEGREIPDGSLVIGAPGKVIRQLDDDAIESLRTSATHYQANARRFRDGLKEI